MINYFKIFRLKKKIYQDFFSEDEIDIKFELKGFVFDVKKSLSEVTKKENILKVFNLCQYNNVPVHIWNGHLDLSNCNIDDLYGFPQIVSKNIILNNNNLKNFKGDLKIVKGSLFALNNKIEDMQDFPLIERGKYSVKSNDAIVLDGNRILSLEVLQHKIDNFNELDISVRNMKSLKEIGWKCNNNIKLEDFRCDVSLIPQINFKLEALIVEKITLEQLSSVSDIDVKTLIINKLFDNKKQVNNNEVMLEKKNLISLMMFLNQENYYLTEKNFITKKSWHLAIQQTNDKELCSIMTSLNSDKKIKFENKILTNTLDVELMPTKRPRSVL